jgi:hypothetical protein
MIGRIEPKDLPSNFVVNGTSVPYALMKTHFKKQFGAPISGYTIECAGDDGKTYFVAARIMFEQDEHDRSEWSRIGWDVEFYSTRKAALRMLKTGWKRVFQEGNYDAAEDAA